MICIEQEPKNTFTMRKTVNLLYKGSIRQRFSFSGSASGTEEPSGIYLPLPQQIIFWVLLNKKGHIPRGMSPPGYHLGRCCSLMLTQ
ncbi:hypothetical protein XENTR_v10023148 [Xenopus tropicalis]|nr:hypothetical protein XENTR_v10023148 [Xenopus tropicalis]